MILDAKPFLEERVVIAIGQHPGLSIDELYAMVARTENCARSSIYQEVRKLCASGVVARSKGKLTLRIGWLADLRDFAAVAWEKHVQPSALQIVLPEAESKSRWKCRSLQELGKLWTNLLVAMLPSGSTLFEWAYIPWFGQSHPFEESQLTRTLAKHRVTHSLILGDDNWISRQYLSDTSSTKREVHYGWNPFRMNEREYLSVIGDYVLVARIHKSTAAKLKDLASLQSKSGILPGHVARVFTAEIPSTLTVRNDHTEAARLTAKFERVMRG